jgi:hypothetical protein
MPGKRVLLVEGNDDEHVVKSVCGDQHLGNIDTIRQAKGISQLLDMVSPQLKESDISILGIILDADTDLPARWEELKFRLEKEGYQNIDNQPTEEGTILLPPPGLLPKVGIWIMPDNKLAGTLEDFLKFLIPENDSLLTHAQQALDGLPEQRFTNTNQPKALIHTWLAWQEKPGMPYGQAITARYLDSELPLGQAFANWLKNLFFE